MTKPANLRRGFARMARMAEQVARIVGATALCAFDVV
jgi:hypothetical protein